MTRPSPFQYAAYRVACVLVLASGLALALWRALPHVPGNPQYDAIVRAHAHRGTR
jgi:hypothetical protein